jgi:hypothetical protein
MNPRLTPVTAICNMIAAAVFGLAAGVALASSDFRVFHSWLFALGAVAFASNLGQPIHPIAWLTGALVQALCLLELLGFTAGMTSMARSGSLTLPNEWWISLALWGILAAGVNAFVGTLAIAREQIDLLIPEGFHSVDPHRAPHGHVTREQSDRSEQQRRAAERDRIDRRHAEQQTNQDASGDCRERQPDRRADADQ